MITAAQTNIRNDHVDHAVGSSYQRPKVASNRYYPSRHKLRATAPHCSTIFHLPDHLAEKSDPCSSKKLRSAVTRISRAITTTAIHDQISDADALSPVSP